MHVRASIASGLLLLFSVWDAAAQGLDRASLEGARALRTAALQSNEAYALVTSLTTEVGPRFAGSPGDRAAVEWAERELTRLGFSRVRRMDVTVPRWIRGAAELTMDDELARPFAAVALGGSIGTPEGGIRAEVVAVRDFDELAGIDAQRVRGRIVYIGRRMERTNDGSGYGAAVRGRTAGPSAAAAKGAAGLVIRSIGTSDNRLAHTGSTTYDASQPRIPAVALSNPDADTLERLLAGGAPLRLRMRVTARDLPETQSANVLGEIRGTDRADEIVLLGAHLDSWDTGDGALDDGSGVAIVMAAARLIADAHPRPRRTIRVVLFANEEFGLSGSRAYAGAIGDELARHAVGMEADLGDGPVRELASRVPQSLLPLVAKIHELVAPLGVARGDNKSTSGADLTALRRAGMPLIAPQLDATRYFDHHHTANDTLDKVDPKRLAQSVAVFAVTAYLAARADVDFPHLAPEPAQQ